jgi:uncharacterized cupredoxin-like copper-binding protein
MSVRPLPLLVSAAALAVAGCGGGGAKTSGASALHIKADPSGQLKFNVSALRASAGTVKIVMANPSQLSHSVAIQGNGVNAAGQVVGPSGTSTVSAKLKPGKYTFFCTVPGHRQAGMQGTLTVK